jgi:hypothetical protein
LPFPFRSWYQGNGSLARDLPVFFGIKRKSAIPSVIRIFAGPENFPNTFPGRCKKRLRRRIEAQIPAEVHEEKPIVTPVAKETQDKCCPAEYGAVYSIWPLGVEDRILAAEIQEIAMEGVSACMALAFRHVKLAAFERLGVRRVREAVLHFLQGEARKLPEEFVAPLFHRFSGLCPLIGKV